MPLTVFLPLLVSLVAVGLLPHFPSLAMNLRLEASLCLCRPSYAASFGKCVPVVVAMEAVCGQGPA